MNPTYFSPESQSLPSPRISVKNELGSLLAAALVVIVFASSSAFAANLYWDGNGTSAGAGTAPAGTWGSSAFWSTSSAGTATTANTLTTTADQLVFSAGSDATGSYTITVSGTQNARQLSIEEGTLTFSGGTINLGSASNSSATAVVPGIVLATGAGDATISSNLGINGLQIFNIGSGRKLTLNTGTFTRSAGSSLNVQGAGTVTSTMSGLRTADLVNGIVGPWATFGTGSSMKYATIDGSNNIVGLTGTSAATAADVTDTTGTFNYDVAGGTSTLATNASVNTLRHTGTSGTISGNLTANGLMNANNSGRLTLIGTITIGSTKELVVIAAHNNISFTGVVRDNGSGASSLLVTHPSNNTNGLTLSGANTYSGGTTISNAQLVITNNNALGTGAVTVLKGSVNTGSGDFGGQLAVSNNITWSNNMTLSGQGLPGFTGALQNTSGNNTYTGTITISDTTTRIQSAAGSLSLNGTINLTTASGYGSLFQHVGDIRLGGNGITGSATGFTILGGGSNYLITDRANAWAGTTGLILGGGSTSTAYGRLDLNGFDQTVATLSAVGTDATQNIITNRSGTLATLTYNNSSGSIFDGTLSGNLALTKNGSSTLTLTSNNTHTGATTVAGGTLLLSGNGTLGTSAMSISGGTLDMWGKSLANTFGSLTAGTLSNGTLTNNGGNYNLQNGTVSAVLAGTNGVNKTTSGTVTLSGNNTYAGTTTLNAGVLTITSNSSLPGIATNGRYSVANGATLGVYNAVTDDDIASMLGTTNFAAGAAIGFDTSTANRTYSRNLANTLQGALGLTKLGSNTLTLSAANTYSGDTLVSAGTLTLSNALALQNSALDTSGAGVITLSSVTTPTFGGLKSSSNLSSVITTGYSSVTGITLNPSSGVSNTYSGVISNGAAGMTLTKNGSGTQILSGNNTYTGTTTINAGTLQLGHANALGAITSGLVVNGTLDLNGNSITKSTLSGSTGNITSVSAATLTLNNTNAAIGTYNGAIGGNVALSITNSNTSGQNTVLTLGGSNTYTGNTTIYNSALAITNGAALGNSTVIVQKGGQTGDANFGGQIRLSGDITVSNNMTLAGQGYGTFNGALQNTSGNNTYTGTITISDTTTRIQSAAGSLSLNGAINLTTASGYGSLFQHVGDIRLGGNGITGSATGFTVFGGGSNYLIADRANAWAGTTGITLGGGSSSTAYGRLDLNGNNQALNTLSAVGTDATQNIITNRSGTLATLTINSSSGSTFAGTLSGNLALTKAGSSTLILTSNNTYGAATTVAGGTLLLSGNGTLGTSTISISGGTLDMGGKSLTNTFGSLTGGTLSNGTLTNNGGNYNLQNGTVSAVLAGTNGVNKTGSGTVTLSGANTYNGTTTVTLGTLALGANNVISDSSNLVINGGTFDISTYSDTVGIITMTNGNLIGSTGVLTGSAYNITGGNVTAQLSGGTLVIGNGTTNIGTVGSNVALSVNDSTAVANLTANVLAQSVSLNNGGSITGSFSLNQTGGVTANSGSIASNLIGSGGVTMNGTGNTLTLTGSNSYTGATTISAGNLSISSAAALGSTSGINLANATALIYTGAAGSLTRDITVTSGTGTIRNTGGALTLSGALSKNGTTLTLAGGSNGITVSGVISGSNANSDLVIDGGTTTLASANSYNGPTFIINGATLNANITGALPTSTLTAVTINGSSTLALGASQSVASLSGTSGSLVNLNANTLTINGSSSTTYSGGISGTGNLVKNGSGTQTLAGATTFNGTTTVNSGTLKADAANALGGTTNIDVNGGSLLVAVANAVNSNANINLNSGTLAVSGDFNQNVGALTLSADSVIDLDGFSGILRFSGLSWASTSPNAKLAIWNWSGTPQHGPPVNDYTNPSHVVFTSNANLTPENLAKISFYSDSGSGFVGNAFEKSFTQSGFATGTEIIAVPEPETYLTGVILLLGGTIYLFRRAKHREGHRPAWLKFLHGRLFKTELQN